MLPRSRHSREACPLRFVYHSTRDIIHVISIIPEHYGTFRTEGVSCVILMF